MAKYQIVYWQDIPSQVDARDGGETHKEVLSPRFQELIDLVAMKKKLTDSDDYINGWSKGEKTDRSGSATEVARSVAAEIEARYDEIRATALAQCAPD
jgi:hypothetical protein